jgi:hypothetical protein
MLQSQYFNPDAASAQWRYRTERLSGRNGQRSSGGQRRFLRARRAA